MHGGGAGSACFDNMHGLAAVVVVAPADASACGGVHFVAGWDGVVLHGGGRGGAEWGGGDLGDGAVRRVCLLFACTKPEGNQHLDHTNINTS